MAVRFLARIPGKPPLRHAVVDVRIRNPLRDAVWFLYDFSDDLPTVVNSVTLSRTSSTPPHAYLWSLAGDGGGQAVRVPAGADLALRDLELSSASPDATFSFAFASSVTLGEQSAEQWLGRPGLSPAMGDFRLKSLLTDVERSVDDLEMVSLGVQVLCVEHLASEPR